jgi:hypothetical protein
MGTTKAHDQADPLSDGPPLPNWARMETLVPGIVELRQAQGFRVSVLEAKEPRCADANRDELRAVSDNNPSKRQIHTRVT